jgi:hypothetical protein
MQTFSPPDPSNPQERDKRKGGGEMFGAVYDKADWAVGVLLVVAIVAAMFV